MKETVKINQIHNIDALEGLKQLPDQSVQCVVTSPPYWGLRNYKVEGQLGLEKTPDEYVQNLVNVFNEVWRVLKDDGTVWLNIGDTYSSYKDQSVRNQTVAGHSRDEPAHGLASNRNGAVLKQCGLKHKELVGIPWRVAFALQKAGWYLRSDIIWAKAISFCDKYVGSCMPESVRDRPTRSHEYIFLLTKQPYYFYDKEAIKEDGVWPAGTKAAKGSGKREGNRREEAYAVYNGKRNPRSVWAIQTKPYKEAHFATFPEKLIEPMIKAGTKSDDVILDPFMGSGTSAVVAKKLNRNFIGFELNKDYCKIAQNRLKKLENDQLSLKL